MDRLIGFIDFGYLRASGAQAHGKRTREVRPDPAEVVKWLDQTISAQEGASFLRAYWYDGAFDPWDPRRAGQDSFFRAIARTPGIQLRLGHIQELTPKWQHAVKAAVVNAGLTLQVFERHFTFRPELNQKGVDTLITLDLVRLAQRRAFDTAVLIAGDRDLAEPVRAAQDEGRRVLVAVPEGAGLARELKELADEVLPLETSALQAMITLR